MTHDFSKYKIYDITYHNIFILVLYATQTIAFIFINLRGDLIAANANVVKKNK